MNKSEAIIKEFNQYVVPSYKRNPIVMVKGKGTKVWDADGKVYLDFLAGIAVNNIGHSHPGYVSAVEKQLEQLVHVSNLYYNEPQGKLAKKLIEISRLDGKCFFCNSGAEANEALIKLARLWGHEQGRYEIITMKNSFHGRTLGTLTATGQDKVKKGFDPLPMGFLYAEFNNIESVKALINEKTVAVLVECIQGEGGVIPATQEFLKELQALCKEKNLLLLCDEVQCGMGRTGKWFGFQQYGIEPDAISIAKALGNGFPIGAIVTNKKLADVFQPGSHASTFGGTALACSAALATISIIEEENLLERCVANGDKFMNGLKEIAAKYPFIKEIRGKGLMIGMVLNTPAKEFEQKLIDMGLLCLATADYVIRFLPPLNVKDSEIEEALDMIADVCEEMQSASSTASAENAPAQG